MGHKICSSCGIGIVKTQLKSDMKESSRQMKEAFAESRQMRAQQAKTEDFATKINRLGVKLTVHLTLPIVLFFIGIFTFPIGILFWILAVALLAGLFTTKK